MPKMGESISEATIISWLKNVGDFVEAEETILEVATDKVDSDVPAPVSGVITEIRFQKDAVVEVGTVLALIEMVGNRDEVVGSRKDELEVVLSHNPRPTTHNLQPKTHNLQPTTFISPLIISIAQKENLSIEELQAIPGSGTEGRLQKSDVFNYLKNRKYPIPSIPQPKTQNLLPTTYPKPKINFTEGKDRIVEMDRMRKMIADHMVYSKQTSPHVTSYIEVDVTNLVNWRNENKDKFQEKHNEN